MARPSRSMCLALLSKHTSRRNKIALLAECERLGYDVKWCWNGTPYETRLLISINGQQWRKCSSYDEDIRPTLKDK